MMIPLVAFAGKKNAAMRAGSVSAVPEGSVSILHTESGEVETISEREYAIGAVFAQMPADFEPEALKAQAVLAYTYAARRRLIEEQSPTPELGGALMSDDTSMYQAYFGEEKARAVYGEKYPEALKKITEAADSVKGLTLCCEGEPVIAAFHGISFGRTESAFTMWGEDIPYLRSADSSSDSSLEICRRTVSLTDSEIAGLLPELSESDIPKLTISEQSEHGTALSLRAGDTIVKADTFAEKLSLPSQHIDLTRTENGWDIGCMGCGHLVGMSQYGANSMAAEGMTFEQILLHYYSGCVLVKR